MLIKEIEPIDAVGVDLLKREDAEAIIEQIIELPLRKACRIFRKKGIQTAMSSANKSNVLKSGEEPTEKEDVYNVWTQWMFTTPTFDNAGKGYAWIMLNWDTLSDENKDLLFSLEERKGKNGENIGGKAIWFVQPCVMGSIEHDLKVGKYGYDFLRQAAPEADVPDDIQVDLKLVEFEKRRIILGYNNEIYPTQSVFLRMPINEQTTVEEVEEFFAKFAETFRKQTVEQEIKQPAAAEEEIEL